MQGHNPEDSIYIVFLAVCSLLHTFSNTWLHETPPNFSCMAGPRRINRHSAGFQMHLNTSKDC
jgi:hypothetical protein